MNNLGSWTKSWKNRGMDLFRNRIRPAIKKQSETSVNPFADFSWGDTKWSGLIGTATSMLGDGVSNAVNMGEKQKLYADNIATYGQGAYDDLYDNSSLIMAGMMPAMSTIRQEDIRDTTWGEDISSSLVNGLSAGLSTGNPYIGIGVAAIDFGNNIRERFNAKRTAEELERRRRDRMRLLGDQYYTAAQGVDERNDFNRMMSYFENPYDYAFGGPLHSNGGDYNGGLTYIDEGGRHEENPYEGVPSGFDEEGNPNLVEEGEVIWNNEYVFSDRLKVPKELATKYKLGGKKDYTFAEAIEKLTKENTLSPNDFITIATTKEIVNEFMDAQEAIREKNQLAAREELEAAQAQDFLAQLNAAQGMAPSMGAPVNMGQVGMEMPNEAPLTEGEMMPPGYAVGGNKFYGGGWENLMNFLENKYNKSLTKGGISGTYAIDKNFPLGNYKTIEELEQSDIYRRFTDYVIDHSDDEDVQAYLKLLDKKTHSGVTKLFENGKLRKGWEDLYRHRRNDHAGGIYHFSASVDNILKGLDSKQASKEPTPEDEQKRLMSLLQGIPFPGKVEGYPDLHYVDKDGHRYYLDTSTIKFYDDLSKVPGYKAPEKPQTGGRVIYTYPSGNKITVNPDGTVSDPEHGASYSNYDEFLNDPSWSLNLEESVVSDIKKSGPLKGTKPVSDLNATEHDEVIPFKYRPTWQREVPSIGAAMDWLYRRLNRPDYSNADRIIEAANRMGTPINIPVETIGDYRRRNPYDERYLVNMANQNRAAAARGIANTSGGNRSMDLLGNMSLAHSSQYDLGEIMRQAYLANRQDDAQVADFNRGTNVYNMSAINQRNLSQAQLNTHRQQAGLSGLAQGYGLRQTIHDNWDDAAMESYNSLLASLGAIGKENEEYNVLTSMAEHNYFPWYYGDRSVLQHVPQSTAKGGKLNRKKRRF